jgi:hypothetical protein
LCSAVPHTPVGRTARLPTTHPVTSEAGLSRLAPPARLAELPLGPLLRAAAAAAARAPRGLQAAAAMPAAPPGASAAMGPLERAALRRLQADVTVVAAAGGRCDAVALWLEFEAPGGGVISTGSTAAAPVPPSCSGAAARPRAEQAAVKGQEQASSDDGEEGEAAAATACARACSVRQGLSHLDAPAWVAPRGALRLALRPAQQGTSLAATIEPLAGGAGGLAGAAPAGQAPYRAAPQPRHALLPAWHFPMLADAARNGAFDAAIRWGGAGRGGAAPCWFGWGGWGGGLREGGAAFAGPSCCSAGASAATR